VNRNVTYLTPSQLKFLRRVVGLTATRDQLEEILNAPPGNVYSVELVVRQGAWVVKPTPAKRKRGWPAGRKRTAPDRLNPGRTGRPRKTTSNASDNHS
jgi:hypothetical protein